MDGLRALAVLAVVWYHLSPRSLPSGYLGVDVFMVVSGFLITGLLVREFDRTGRVHLAAFWGRRFRRLVPALVLMLFAVALWTHLAGPRALSPSIHSQGLAALFYVSNWKLIADGVTYGGAVGASCPLVHLWSLAVEEQFYLLWPPLLVGLLTISRGHRRRVAVVAGLGALASALLMARFFANGHDTIRAYYGTDTRAQAFLIGALAALVAPQLRERGRLVVRRLGVIGLAGLAVVVLTDVPDLLYRGGFAVVAVLAAFAVVATTMPGPVTRGLDRAPLRAIGRVSYGIYLWHWPAITLLTPERLGLTGLPVTVVRLAATGAGAAGSWFAIERRLPRVRAVRIAFASVPAMSLAAIGLVTLPASQVIAYASYRIDEIPKVSVVVPAAEIVARVRVPARVHRAVPIPLKLPRRGTAMIVGDSGMYDATPALARGLSAAGWRVVETAFPAEGLTRPSTLLDDLAGRARYYHVDLTIVMIGIWDIPWLATHSAASYRGVLDASIAAFAANGGKVEWLSTLPGGGHNLTGLDAMFREIPSRHPAQVEYVNIQPVLRAPDGTYPLAVGGHLLRKPDGWHLCPDGAAAIAHVALDRLGLDRTAWDSGRWRFDARYNDPPGGCRPR